MIWDYAAKGRIGLGTPQANPTVEDEARRLLPPDVGLNIVRLTSRAEKPADRLKAYLTDLPQTLTRFDTMALDVFAFACTASAYLLGAEEERRILQRCSKHHPVISATMAIRWALEQIGAKRILVAAPYPEDIRSAALTFWQGQGFVLNDVHGIAVKSSDTRSIYKLTARDAQAALDTFDLSTVDAVLLSGTGMPSLPALAQERQVPVISSNLALAAYALHHLEPDLVDGYVPKGWQTRA